MGKKQFIDRKNARHFHLVHRSQRDPLSRDESAPQRVLKEVIPANLVGKVPQPREEYDNEYSDGEADIFGGKGDLDGINYGTYDREDEEVELIEAPRGGITAGASHYLKADHKHTLGKKDEDKIGEAALLGLVDEEFNDGSYDYTQHFKEIGRTADSVFVPAKGPKQSIASKGIQFTDASAAEEMSRDPTVAKSAPKKALRLPSGVLQSREELDFADVYQSAMPEGLQPDMNADLREVLEALEDEEFEDADVGEDFFDVLDADEVDAETVHKYKNKKYDLMEDDDDQEGEAKNGQTEDWQAQFRKFKQERYAGSDDESFEGSDDDYEDDGSSASRYSRRPAGASASTFSMSSSAMFRNENLTHLDERFDKIEREYEDSDDEEEDEEGPLGPEREDLDSILDDFLDKFEIVGSKMVPRLEGATSENKLSTMRRAMLVDDAEDEKSVATTVGGTRRSKKNLDDDVATELQTDFRSRAERLRDSWDVQTILSTYSNLDNHPGMIKEQNRRRIHIDPKTGMPVVTEKLSKKALVKQQEMMDAAQKSLQEGDSDDDFEEDDSEGSGDESENLGVKRNKAETKEEKKARKEAIKQEKKMRRETKKSTKTAFASERSRQEKVMKNLKKGHGVTHID